MDWPVFRALCAAAVLWTWHLQVSAREVSITVLHTCDLHGNVLPTEDYQGQTNLGGIARCATVIREIRQREKNVLLLDAGDTIQGTAASYLSGGQIMVKALNRLRYDVWCWGNHEFDWGLEKLAACADAATMPILNANVTGSAEQGGPAGRILQRLKSYVLLEAEGVKIGIIGLNTPGIPNWSRPRLIQGLKFLDSVETLRSVVPAVRRAGAQVIILVCHQGYKDAGDDHANQINAIARAFPELDVIIGGHTHRNFPEYKVSNILYCQADYFGIHLGRVDLIFDSNAGRVVQRKSNTLLMDGSIALDREILDAGREELERAAKWLDACLGEATDPFIPHAGPKQETSIHDLLFESIVEALRERRIPVDAVVHGLFESDASLSKGAITVRDVFRIVPYENTLGVLSVTPAQLREVLDENAGAFERREFRGIAGLKWVFDPGAASNQTVSLTRSDGTQLNPTNRLLVAFNSYELASGGLRWNKLRDLADLPECRLAECEIQTRQAVIEFIQRHGEISPVIRGWWKTERPTR